MFDPTGFIFQLIVLIFSVMIHEVSHGYIAEWLGDPTARLAGRLTLNPIKHIDPMGSIMLPLILSIPALFGQPTFIFGWAKPVPYNPNNLKDPKSGAALIGIAGPLSNFLLALVFGFIIRGMVGMELISNEPLLLMLATIVQINIFLGLFNLVPIPPLDGSKALFAILPFSMRGLEDFLMRWNIALLLLFIFYFSDWLRPLARIIFRLMVGAS